MLTRKAVIVTGTFRDKKITKKYAKNLDYFIIKFGFFIVTQVFKICLLIFTFTKMKYYIIESSMNNSNFFLMVTVHFHYVLGEH